MGPLAGRQVPIDRETVIEVWQEYDPSTALQRDSREADDSAVRTGPRDAEDYGEIINELVEIGVITKRANRKLDLPDVYRIGFDLGRRGGVPRIQS
jgi:hypothetical protein